MALYGVSRKKREIKKNEVVAVVVSDDVAVVVTEIVAVVFCHIKIIKKGGGGNWGVLKMSNVQLKRTHNYYTGAPVWLLVLSDVLSDIRCLIVITDVLGFWVYLRFEVSPERKEV